MITDVLQVIIGLAFFAFIPGWFVTKIFFEEKRGVTMLVLSAMFSIMIAIVIGVFFGYDRAQAAATGGFTTRNIWAGELLTTTLLAIIYIIKQTFMKKVSFQSKKRKKRREVQTKLREDKKE